MFCGIQRLSQDEASQLADSAMYGRFSPTGRHVASLGLKKIFRVCCSAGKEQTSAAWRADGAAFPRVATEQLPEMVGTLMDVVDGFPLPKHIDAKVSGASAGGREASVSSDALADGSRVCTRIAVWAQDYAVWERGDAMASLLLEAPFGDGFARGEGSHYPGATHQLPFVAVVIASDRLYASRDRRS